MSLTNTVAARAEERDFGTFSQARWLAWQEVKRAWLSYPVTALATLLIGVLAAGAVDGILVVEGAEEDGRRFERLYNVFFADFIFLVFCSLLAVNWMSRDYFRVFSEDAFSERVVFVRGLPVSTVALVAGRVISMGPSLLLNALAFFVPVYLISDLRGLGWGFAWFVAAWLGYALFGAGLLLLAELGLAGRTYVGLSFASVPALMVAIALLEWAVDLMAVGRVVGLVQAHGPLPTLVSVSVGAAGLVLLAGATVRRVRRREMSP